MTENIVDYIRHPTYNPFQVENAKCSPLGIEENVNKQIIYIFQGIIFIKMPLKFLDGPNAVVRNSNSSERRNREA